MANAALTSSSTMDIGVKKKGKKTSHDFNSDVTNREPHTLQKL